jgi:hypothetical protein
MLDRKQIEAQVKDLPKDKCVAFAVRSAMRVLPILAIPERKPGIFNIKLSKSVDFWFWNEDIRTTNLLAIFRAYGCSIENVNIQNYTYSNAAPARAAYAAADAAISIENEIFHDLSVMNKFTAKQLLEQVLWHKGQPKELQTLYQDFKQAVLRLNAGFDIWLNWYEARLQGKAMDWDLLRQWNSIPPEVLAQGAAKVNAQLKWLSQKRLTFPLNRVRAILIGNGEAGKTSLIRALHGEEVIRVRNTMSLFHFHVG